MVLHLKAVNSILDTKVNLSHLGEPVPQLNGQVLNHLQVVLQVQHLGLQYKWFVLILVENTSANRDWFIISIFNIILENALVL